MTITLTPEIETMIRQKIDSGRFASSVDVIREALRALDEWDKLRVLKRDIDIGIEQAERGQVKPVKEVFGNVAKERRK